MSSPNREVADTRFEVLAQSAPDAILTIDAHSIILSANPATERIFGYPPEELVGQPLTRLIPQRLRVAHDEGVARYLRTHRRNIPWTGVQLPGLTKDGREIPVEISFGEFADAEGRPVFSGFVRDVSERVRYERALEQARTAAERALRELAMLERVTSGALNQGTYDDMLRDLLHGLREELHADAAAVLLRDESSDELVMRAVDGIAPDLVADVVVPIGRGISGRVAATRQPLVIEDIGDVEVMSPKLHEQITSVAAVPVLSAGETIGVVHIGSRARRQFTAAEIRLLEIVAERMAGVFARTRLYEVEVRAREEAEAARQTLAEHEAALRRLNVELEQQRAEAEAAVRTRDDVLSIVSHDLRNPVSTVVMSVSLLQDPDFPLTEEQRSQQLDVITRSAQRMNRLIQDLLDVARIEGGRLTINCRCEDPAALAIEVCDDFRPIAADKEQTLLREIDPTCRRIYADRDRVVQVLSNYLNNAVKFTPTGGTITLRLQPDDEGGVRYSVSDTGPGIADEDRPRLFGRFWQAKHTAHLGSGLGLAIAKGIAEAHHGRVWAESTLGVGSTFFFSLPHSEECA